MIREGRKRATLGLALLFAAASAWSQIDPIDPLPYPRGLAAWLPLGWLSTLPGQATAFAIALVGLVLFVSGRRVQLGGWIFFACVLVMHSVTRSVHADESDRTQGSQMPCATLAAWLIGVWLAPRIRRDPELLGGALASGVVAAAYTMAAWSKLRVAGVAWIDGRTLALMIYERGDDAPAIFAAIRHTIGGMPYLCGIGMATVLAIEASGSLFLFRRMRRPFATAALAFHLSSGLLLGYLHPDWALTVVAWGWIAGGAASSSPKGPDANGGAPST